MRRPEMCMSNDDLQGVSLLGGGRGHRGGGPVFCGRNPAAGEALAPEYHSASSGEMERAAQLAADAAPACAGMGGGDRGRFLRAIAERLEENRAGLVDRAHLETALPQGRLDAELTRTCLQLQMFASLVEEGSWVDARLDQALDQAGAPAGPSIRSLLRPLGPVAVFGASNFPFAFSVAGGDTASALAAGNPVIVKAHPAHPGTSELTGKAVADSVRGLGMPEGTFSLLFDRGVEIGSALVRHPAIRAVGFTGSQRAGRHLMDLTAARPRPIPVYAEMGSANPVFLLPRALAVRGEEIAKGLERSVTLGAGQFCTKPGLVVVGHNAGSFLRTLAAAISRQDSFNLLTEGLAASYRRGVAVRCEMDSVTVLAAPPSGGEGGAGGGAALFQTEASAFLAHPELAEELFGPSTLLIRHRTRDELMAIARSLDGNLTATVHATEDDLREYEELLPVLASRVGRVIVNGFPTGVAVTDAMVHGGPYPAGSDGSSSVGTRAILRFTRPVCFQDVPDYALPPELQDSNPLRIWRRVQGRITAP